MGSMLRPAVPMQLHIRPPAMIHHSKSALLRFALLRVASGGTMRGLMHALALPVCFMPPALLRLHTPPVPPASLDSAAVV